MPHPDLPPIGMALRYGTTPLHRLRNHAMRWFVRTVVFRGAAAALAEQRRALGLASRSFDIAPFNPCLAIQPSVPELDYPYESLPPQLHFVGPLLPVPAVDTPLPPWWDVLDEGRCVVVVTQGTLATDATELIAPTLAALADRDDILVVAAGVDEPSRLGVISNNARVERFVPFGALLPHADVLVTNGGYGGVTAALAHGVPVVCAGKTEDKPEVARRVAYAGVGIDLRTARPSPAKVARAVDQVLTTTSYRDRARIVQAALARHDAARESADLLEALVRLPSRERGEALVEGLGVE